MKSIFTLLLLCTVSELFACSCSTLPKIDKQAVAQARDIFTGKVIKAEVIDSRTKRVIFQLNERLKTDSATQITIYTGLGGGDCGLDMQEGQQWYVFTYESNGQSHAGLCGRSALLSAHTILDNTYKRKYYKQAVKAYKQSVSRAKKEIQFIRKTTAANTSLLP